MRPEPMDEMVEAIGTAFEPPTEAPVLMSPATLLQLLRRR